MGSKRRFHTLQMLCFILAFWPHFSLSNPQPCNAMVVVGDEVTIPLQYPQLKEGDELVWKHGDKIVFEKKRTVITGRKEDVTSSGSLILHRIQINQSGPYSAEVYDGTTGSNLYKTVKNFNLCVRGELVYGSVGKDVQLDPKVTGTINNITWNKENNKIAEWNRNSELDYYDQCLTVNECELNPITGLLKIKGLKRENEGRYSAEINGKTPEHDLQLFVLSKTTQLVYGLIGKEVQLDPKVTETIGNITWKTQVNKILEWDRNSGHNYYDRCGLKDQCFLNPTTGVFIMKGLKPEDEGRYSAEVNNKGLAKEFQLIVLKPVSKPRVSIDCNETHCTLSCMGKESQYTRYSWKQNGKITPGKNLLVDKTGDQSKSYSCVVSNPKTEKDSDPVSEMDLFRGPGSKASSPGPPVGYIAAGVLMPLFLMVVEL